MAEQNGIIQLKDIDVTFNNEGKTIEAVKDISIDVQKGDVYGIIGYSGAGKKGVTIRVEAPRVLSN